MVFYLLCTTIAMVLSIMVILLFLRAILSWMMPMGQGNRFTDFLECATEFAIAPVRSFMERFEFVRRSPLDLSFFVTFLLVQLMEEIFSSVAKMFL